MSLSKKHFEIIKAHYNVYMYKIQAYADSIKMQPLFLKDAEEAKTSFFFTQTLGLQRNLPVHLPVHIRLLMKYYFVSAQKTLVICS